MVNCFIYYHRLGRELCLLSYHTMSESLNGRTVSKLELTSLSQDAVSILFLPTYMSYGLRLWGSLWWPLYDWLICHRTVKLSAFVGLSESFQKILTPQLPPGLGDFWGKLKNLNQNISLRALPLPYDAVPMGDPKFQNSSS